ncbi:MAG: ACP S-malonyltransferase [Dehalococcoidales bacterium]|nr:ACP S-malonyltransferase [Dehalococcoidales bacterium]
MAEALKTAFIFPGQGSQKTGMGRDLFENVTAAREVFEEADRVLDFPLSRLCFEGPEDDLRQTYNAQPALVTMSIACYRAALSRIGEDKIITPALLAGHSLGEYSALVLAGVLDFRSAVFLARERGRLMHEAGQSSPGAMAAILGMAEKDVAAICRETGTWLANINCPGQVVVSGARENIEKAIEAAKAGGAARALPLQVSGAFHSPLMQPAVEGLSAVISKMSFNDPLIPVIANTSALPLIDSAGVKEELTRQLCNGVRWQDSMQYMIDQGISRFIEIGPGNVLTGLMKRINKDMKTLNVGNLAELENLAR